MSLKTAAVRLYVTHRMTLNYRTYLRRILKKSCLTLITVKPLEKTKFLKDGAEVLTLSLRNIYKKLLINLLTFYEECKIAKLKSVFKGGTRTS